MAKFNEDAFELIVRSLIRPYVPGDIGNLSTDELMLEVCRYAPISRELLIEEPCSYEISDDVADEIAQTALAQIGAKVIRKPLACHDVRKIVNRAAWRYVDAVLDQQVYL